MLLDLLAEDGFTPIRKGPDEWCSPCPACGGRDRFIVHSEKGRYWCRGCGVKGDVIQYLRDRRGMTFHQAAEYAGRPASSPAGQRGPRAAQAAARTTPTPPPEAWAAQAEKLATEAHKALLGKPARLEWLRAKRGLTRETAERFRLGWIERDIYMDRAAWALPPQLREDGKPKRLFLPAGLLIPGPDRLRIRRTEPGRFGKYFVVQGSSNRPLVIGAEHPAETTGAIILESELDALLLAQELPGPVLIVAMGSTSNGPDQAMVADLARRPFVLVALDTDQAGGKATWQKWMGTIPNATRAPVPATWGKDHTDAFLAGHNLGEWFRLALRLAEPRTRPTTTQAKPVPPFLPGWCRPDCKHLRHLALRALPAIWACYHRRPGAWGWFNLARMAGCPMAKGKDPLPALPPALPPPPTTGPPVSGLPCAGCGSTTYRRAPNGYRYGDGTRADGWHCGTHGCDVKLLTGNREVDREHLETASTRETPPPCGTGPSRDQDERVA